MENGIFNQNVYQSKMSKANNGISTATLSAALLLFCFIFCWNCKKDEPSSDFPTEPGRYELSINIGEHLRWYTIVIPTGYDHNIKRPLVFAFHPGGGNMTDFMGAFAQFLRSAEEENWIVVFPNGANTTDNRTGDCTWNGAHCCWISYTQNVDDVGFVQKLIDKMQQEYKIDDKRIYATGRSNGGMLVHRLGAELGNTFAAIAPFNATAGGQFTENDPEVIINPMHPLPILMMHGLNDFNVKFHGGLSVDGDRHDISFAATTEIWLKNNACDPSVSDTTFVDTDEGKTWVVEYTDCAEGAQVIAIAVEKCGHNLPRLVNSGFDGTQAIVDFFKAH